MSDNIDLEKLNTFGSSTEIWSGAMEDTTLFKIWKRTHIELNELSIPIDEPTHNTISAVWFPEKNDVKIFSNHNADDEDLQISHNWKEEICHDDSNSFEQHQYNLSPSSVNEVNVSQRSANDSCVNPCNSNPHVVPSSFKNHFYFPKLENEEPKENKIKEEKLPCVVSINSFQDYLKNKMQKKEVNEQLKKEWVGKRRKNKREKNSKKK